MKKLLMGNEAIAFGAIRANVSVITGYPGTPSTEILECVAKNNENNIYVEWSVNEKAALEVGAGAAYSGMRVMVTMKQVGLNAASDPLMCLNYVGIKGGMVIVVADDPGPISSQTEQDTRHFGEYANMIVFDPTTPEEAYLMINDAFSYSEKYSVPVIFRPTTRICHSYQSFEILENLPETEKSGFVKDSRWVIFPRLAYANHIKIVDNIKKARLDFTKSPFNYYKGNGKKGIVSGGVSFAYTSEALKNVNADFKLMKLSTYPLPYDLILEFMQGLDEILVIEELDPVIEKELIYVSGLHNIKITIKGKLSGDMPVAGENSVDSVSKAICNFLNIFVKNEQPVQPLPALPVRPPVLCAGCPHRASFFAVKEATKGLKAVYSGDIGCYTLGNALPLDMVDTCLCMGAGITIAQGIHRAENDCINFAFIGDSTFFHSGITGIINAVYNQTDIIVVILDNSTTAMTGNQPHPGTGKNMMTDIISKVDIYKLVQSLGVEEVVRCNPFIYKEALNTVKQMLPKKGVRVILYQAPCIAIAKGEAIMINSKKCTNCKLCMKKLGCPAITGTNSTPIIDQSLCTGCGLCVNVCKFNAIGGNTDD